MPNVRIDMDMGNMGVIGEGVPTAYVPRDISKATPKTLEAIQKLCEDGAVLAGKRGSWKTASQEDRLATVAIQEKHKELTAQAVIEHNTAMKGIN